MSEFQNFTQAESVVAEAVGAKELTALLQYPTGGITSYPAHYSQMITSLADRASEDRPFLSRLKALTFTDRDDPRLKELVSYAISFAEPNIMVEMANVSLPPLSERTVGEFLTESFASARTDRIEVPAALRQYLQTGDRPDLNSIVVWDHADESKVYFLFDNSFGAATDTRVEVLIYDESHYMVMSLRGTALANALLDWVALNGCDSVPPVVKSVYDFDKYMQLSDGEKFAAFDTNDVILPLYKFAGSVPPHFQRFDIEP